MKKQNKIWYLIIENIKDSQIIELKRNNNFKDGYIRINKSELRKMPEKLYKKLVNNGLYKGGEYIGFNENNSESSIHRLVSSIYYPCENLEIHHISNISNENQITNLVPIYKSLNQKFERMNFVESCNIARNKQIKLIKRYHKSKNTKFQNFLIIQEIMSKLEKYQIKTLLKTNKKLKKSSIYTLKKNYYYWNLFENFDKKDFYDLYGKYKNSWIKILEFDHLKSTA